MMGNLHIEMAMLSVIGDQLDGSGWTYVMASANVTTEDGLLVWRKAHIHQGLIGLPKYRLLNRSYVEYCTIT